jgi:quinol monooxygenase YgiN
MPIIIVATVTPRPEHRDEVKAAFLAAVEQVHGEDGCELYGLHENDDRFVMIEKWASQDAVKAHGGSPALAKLGADLKGKIVGGLDVVYLQPVPAGDPAKGAL